MYKVKLFCLRVAKALGLFALARYKNRSSLRIICWHGFSTGDECSWAGGIMLSPQTLEKRLQSLTKDYTVLNLDAAVQALDAGTLAPNAVVITLDDGFQSTATLAHPLFKKYNVPYTLYLTTYYANKDLPIVNLVLNYALWKTSLESVRVEKLGITYDLCNKKQKSALFDVMFQDIDALGSLDEKMLAMHAFLELLGLDAREVLTRPWLRLLSHEQIRSLHEDGADIQLHTHRHCFPDDDASLIKEIQENAQAIQDITGHVPTHICYPSGAYRKNALSVLEDLGIKSGTTCHFGLNEKGQNPLLLNRFLDSDSDDIIEFEAHLCGITAMLKKVLHRA